MAAILWREKTVYKGKHTPECEATSQLVYSRSMILHSYGCPRFKYQTEWHISGLVDVVFYFVACFLRFPQACEIGGYTIPEDCSVAYVSYSANRDKTVFTHADEFRPERWSLE